MWPRNIGIFRRGVGGIEVVHPTKEELRDIKAKLNPPVDVMRRHMAQKFRDRKREFIQAAVLQMLGNPEVEKSRRGMLVKVALSLFEEIEDVINHDE